MSSASVWAGKRRQVTGLLALISTAMLSGCGASPSACGGTVAPVSSSRGVRLADVGQQLSMYPGQSVSTQVAVEAAPTDAVTVSVSDLPTGLTVVPAAVTNGVAQLQFKSSLELASECFVGQQNVFTASVPVTVNATGSTGSSSAGMLLTVTLQNPSFTPAKTDLPTMAISTNDGEPVLSKANYVAGSVTITDSTGAADNYAGTMTIKAHGNSTLTMPKTPYQLKLDSKAGLLGMASATHWILLANYDDKTMLRDYLASELGKMFGMPWTPTSRFVELTFNGQYEGTYQVSEKVEIDKHRLNIESAPTVDAAGNDITGGYLFEIDQYKGETFMMTTPEGIVVGSDDPDPPTPDEEVYEQKTLFTAENALYCSNFTSPSAGWRSYFDEDSLINWYLVQELMGNEDANFFSSDYFYKQVDDPLFYMGPLWDFDVSSGNVNYSKAADPNYAWVRKGAAWYTRLFQDPSFQADVRTRWTAMRAQVGTVPALIDAGAAGLALAQQNNYQRWPTLGERVWPNVKAEGNYQGEVNDLKSWMTARIAYLDSQYLN